MEVEGTDDRIRISLSPAELQLLRRALERALFIDTPMLAQGEIAAFSQRALEALVSARERNEILAPRGEKCAPSPGAPDGPEPSSSRLELWDRFSEEACARYSLPRTKTATPN